MIFPKIWIICRVCLKQQDEMFNLFDDTIHKNIWALLRDCSGLPVRKNDCLPDKICELCLTRLWKAMNFRIECQRSHRELLQKQMEHNAILYEEGNTAEVLKVSNISSLRNSKEEQQVFTYLKEDKEITIAEPNSNNSTVDDSDGQNIKQYCVVTKNAEMEPNPGYNNEPQSKQPIVLLLRLKNIPGASSQKEKSDLLEQPETDTNITTKINKRRKTLTETLNKVTEINEDNIKLENKKVKIESETLEELKPKLNKRKTKLTCNICMKNYRTKELLRHHLYTHKRPYECNICHKKFSQGHTFLSHNNYHTGIKPYYCRICFETFSDMCNRNCHERLRHKEKPFKCTSCNKSFRFSALLQKHSNSHRLKKCLICNKDFYSVRLVRAHHQRQHLKLLDL